MVFVHDTSSQNLISITCIEIDTYCPLYVLLYVYTFTMYHFIMSCRCEPKNVSCNGMIIENLNYNYSMLWTLIFDFLAHFLLYTNRVFLPPFFLLKPVNSIKENDLRTIIDGYMPDIPWCTRTSIKPLNLAYNHPSQHYCVVQCTASSIIIMLETLSDYKHTMY